MSSSLPAFRDCLARLVETPSVSCFDPALDMGNRAVLDELAAWCEDMGFRVQYMDMPGHPDKANLLAVAGTGEGGLVLSGHTDTVPCDEGKWSQDPFRLVERDGRYYGLGTSDMKSFFALVVEALRDVDMARLEAPLYLLATCDEESTMGGARALLDSGMALGRFAIIGEPTGLRPINVHKGSTGEHIRLVGRSGHASDPALGNSALEGMHAVIGALLDWRRGWQSRFHDARFDVSVPTLNLGCIHGGDNPNRICGECELMLDLRLLPGMDSKAMHAELRAVVAAVAMERGLGIEFLPLCKGVPAFETPAGSEIVRVAERLSGAAAGAVGFATEGPFLNTMGMDTVILGAGDIAQAHRADEYLAMDRIQPMVDILRGMVGHFCKGGAS